MADTRYITAADYSKPSSAVVKVKLGDQIHRILEAVYPHSSMPGVFCGGGMMQCHIAGEDDIVDKSVNFIAYSNYPNYKESPNCSKCGKCASVCPAGLKVYRLIEHSEKKKSEQYRLLASKCLRCGACSFVCPAGRNLSSRMSRLKA
jgi:electron transport complex protein RnfC